MLKGMKYTLHNMQQMSHPLFQGQHPLFYCYFFFKEYLNPNVKFNKMSNEYNVKYHANPSGLTQDKSFSFSVDPLGLYLSPEFLCLFL